MNNSIGILADIAKDKQSEYASKICSSILSKTNINVVVFHDKLCNIKHSFQTSVLTMSELWGFDGTLICLDKLLLSKISRVTSGSKIIYCPDIEEEIDPLYLFYVASKFSILCLENEDNAKTIARTVGKNIETSVFNNIEEFLEKRYE
jgi:hypothetical protein